MKGEGQWLLRLPIVTQRDYRNTRMTQHEIMTQHDRMT